ncbi:MAG: hypothetical protein KBA02_00710 [Paludibacteraceae bacterium]|nr:hypothetical protein [Paludibacteraceae bacterium]
MNKTIISIEVQDYGDKEAAIIVRGERNNQGDVHPNGKWYWESSANGGKGDWRTIKGTGKATPAASTKPQPKKRAKRKMKINSLISLLSKHSLIFSLSILLLLQ